MSDVLPARQLNAIVRNLGAHSLTFDEWIQRAWVARATDLMLRDIYEGKFLRDAETARSFSEHILLCVRRVSESHLTPEQKIECYRILGISPWAKAVKVGKAMTSELALLAGET